MKGRKIANKAGEKYDAVLTENAALKAKLASYEKPASEPAQEVAVQADAGKEGKVARVPQRPASYAEAALQQREAAPSAQNL